MRLALSIIASILIFIVCAKNVPDEKTLFEQAQKAEAASEYARAFDLYDTFADHYEKSEYRYKAMFMAGYIQMEYLKNPGKAKKIFERLIREYPDCDLADDAAYLREIAATGKDLMSAFQDSLKKK